MLFQGDNTHLHRDGTTKFYILREVESNFLSNRERKALGRKITIAYTSTMYVCIFFRYNSSICFYFTLNGCIFGKRNDVNFSVQTNMELNIISEITSPMKPKIAV